MKSKMVDINSGVPQGSRLGPLLLIIYMNDIINDIESDILIFADDTSLFSTGTDPAQTAAQLTRDLAKISSWGKKCKPSKNALISLVSIYSIKFILMKRDH